MCDCPNKSTYNSLNKGNKSEKASRCGGCGHHEQRCCCEKPPVCLSMRQRCPCDLYNCQPADECICPQVIELLDAIQLIFADPTNLACQLPMVFTRDIVFRLETSDLTILGVPLTPLLGAIGSLTALIAALVLLLGVLNVRFVRYSIVQEDCSTFYVRGDLIVSTRIGALLSVTIPIVSILKVACENGSLKLSSIIVYGNFGLLSTFPIGPPVIPILSQATNGVNLTRV